MSALLFDFPAPAPKPAKKKAKPKGYTEEFEIRIWGPYPRKINCSKLMAFKAWDRMPPDLQAQVLAAMPIFVRSCAGKDESYIPHCATWLNQRRFETVVSAARQPDANFGQFQQPDWPSIMKLYRMTSNWKQENGPPPGNPNCRVPRELLGEML